MKAKIQLQKWIVACLLLISYCSNAQILDWAGQIGNSNWNNCSGTAVDENNNFYAVGFFEDTIDFDPGAGQYNVISTGQNDGYILKLDSNGNFVWLKTISGLENQSCLSVKIEGNRLFIEGDFDGTATFDPGQTNYILTAMSNSYSDIYVMEMDTAGSFKWVKQLMGTDGMGLRDLNLDYSNNILLTGTFSGTVDFNPDITGSFTLTSAGGRDAFVCKLDTGGNFIWAKQIGGTGIYQDGNSIDFDELYGVYVTGEFNGTIDLDPGAGVFSLSTSTTSVLDGDLFICKLDSAGNFMWGMGYGTPQGEFSNKVLYDGAGNIYVSGGFSNTIDFDAGAGVFNMTAAGGGDIFLLKLDTAGNFVWAKQLGSVNGENGIVSIDNLGNLYCAGSFIGTMDADPGSGIHNITGSTIYSNAYIVKLNDQGNFVWATDFNGTWTNALWGLVHDNSGNIYTRGDFNNVVDCDPGTGTYNLTSNGSYDVFFMRLSQPMVGIADLSPDAFGGQLRLVPNPAKDKLTITALNFTPTHNAQFIITDLTGRILQQEIFTGTATVNTTALTPAVYFVTVKDKERSVVRRFVKAL
ncbi:MAG: T9SS type A sorting domain-containing protein [Bacteroidetes bacterium]|nr:T9SS type A sorting domain-containing protein [Bacteroidota bacterium]